MKFPQTLAIAVDIDWGLWVVWGQISVADGPLPSPFGGFRQSLGAVTDAQNPLAGFCGAAPTDLPCLGIAPQI